MSDGTMWAWDQVGLPPALKLVLIALGEGTGTDPADGERRLLDLARWCGMSEPELLEACFELERRGLVRLFQVPGPDSTTLRYALLVR